MGRAQVVQAQAAGVEPSVDMNPILLKPSSDIGSQVIVHGIPVGNMPAKEYFRKKKTLIPAVMESYRRLDEAYDIIVIEGAGSPAEINLKQDDIVNMGMAELAKAPVLLAGDIDRGGVFAQLYGTVMLLTEKERSMVKGLIINKFRGDKSILDPGVEMIEKLCGIPVTGVVPYVDVDIEDEDSLSSRLEEAGREDTVSLVDIAAVRFPRLSNFTDLNVFSTVKGTRVRYVDRLSRLGNPDLIVLPGTKNTMEDLLWLRQSGLEAAILKAAVRGTPIWGICGGYQMMGSALRDEEGTESGQPGRCIAGMGLFPGVTRFHEEKTRTRVRGRFTGISGIFSNLSQMEAEGYEIHMGQTEYENVDSETEGKPLLGLTEFLHEPEDETAKQREEGEKGKEEVVTDGFCSGNLYGTYLHGIFDAPGVAKAIVNALLEKKGYALSNSGADEMDYETYRERQYDKLAAVLREHLNMEEIYRILDEGIPVESAKENDWETEGKEHGTDE